MEEYGQNPHSLENERAGKKVSMILKKKGQNHYFMIGTPAKSYWQDMTHPSYFIL